MFRPFVAALLLTVAVPAFGAKITHYSTDMVFLQGNRVVDTNKLYVSGLKSRTEGMMGGQMISIARKDRGVLWTLYPRTRTFLEGPLTGGKQPGAPDMSSVDLDSLKKEILGREDMLGYACTKMRVSLGNLPNGRPMVATLWVADSLGVPVRLETMGLVQENRNLKPGPQPASLFELPAGYTQTAGPPMPAGTGFPGHVGRGGMAQSASGSPAAVRRPQYGGETATTAGSAMEMNTNRMGGDYREFELLKADPGACQAACNGEVRCLAWTYVKPGGPGERAHCWLKESVMPANPEDCCVSGVKGAAAATSQTAKSRFQMEVDVNRWGEDYKDFVPAKADPAACAEACLGEARCRAWTYVKAQLEGPTGHCWLKSKVSAAGKDTCCISGVKR